MATSTDFGSMHCSIARSFDVIGDPWKALIVRDIQLGLTRFDALIEDLGVSRKVLAERLQTMIDDQIIERIPYQTSPVRYDYLLTVRGADLVPVILAALAWGDRWLAESGGVPAIPLHHGHAIQPVVVCGECGEPLDATAITAAPGPGGRIAPGTKLIVTQMVDPPNG